MGLRRLRAAVVASISRTVLPTLAFPSPLNRRGQDPTNGLASGLVQGFCEGAWMDLSFLRVIGKALQSDGANETLPKVVSLTMADIYLNQDKLGQRLRAHLQCQRLESSRGEFDG